MFRILDVSIPRDGEFITIVLELRELAPSGEKIEVERALRRQEIDSLEYLFSQKEVGKDCEAFDDFINRCPRIVFGDDDEPRLQYCDPLLYVAKWY